MRLAFAVLAALPLAALPLAGCNTTSAPPPAAIVYGNPAITPPGFKLPEGTGCTGDVVRYRAVMANDKRGGQVNDAVFATISAEINSAASACAAGREAEALSLVRASKARHGYPG